MDPPKRIHNLLLTFKSTAISTISPETTGSMITGILESTEGTVEKVVNYRCQNRILILIIIMLFITHYPIHTLRAQL